MTAVLTEEAGSTARRKRVRRLKKFIIISLFTAILLPIVLCVILFFRLNALENEIKEMRVMLAEEQLQIEKEAARVMGNRTEEVREKEDGQPEADTESTVTVSENTAPAHRVYLTFDDGPSVYTDDILDILSEYGVKATFFVVGKEGEKYREEYCRIVEEGHTLGMHSYSHRYGEIYESRESFAQDFIKLQDYLFDVTGMKSSFYRFPGGSSNTVSKVDMSELIDFLEEQDVTYFDWNISAGDASHGGQGVQEIVDNSIASVLKYEESVILMHDAANKRTTVEALPIIIENIQALDNTVIVPITEETEPVQHKKK